MDKARDPGTWEIEVENPGEESRFLRQVSDLIGAGAGHGIARSGSSWRTVVQSMPIAE